MWNWGHLLTLFGHLWLFQNNRSNQVGPRQHSGDIVDDEVDVEPLLPSRWTAGTKPIRRRRPRGRRRGKGGPQDEALVLAKQPWVSGGIWPSSSYSGYEESFKSPLRYNEDGSAVVYILTMDWQVKRWKMCSYMAGIGVSFGLVA
jgi:hypothetical protein